MMPLVLSGKSLPVQERRIRRNPELQALRTEPLLREFITVHHEEEPVLVEEVQVPVGEDIVLGAEALLLGSHNSVLTEVLEAQDEELLAQGPEGLQVREED